MEPSGPDQPMTRRILITIEYDGGPFVGWQRQDNGPSVQTAIENAAKAFIHAPVAVVGAGRTDAGVHATGQAAHIDVPEKFTANRVMEALNSHLSSVPITIQGASEVPGDFHARFTAIGRRYLYRILPRRQPPALDVGRVWHHKQKLDPELMARLPNIYWGTTILPALGQANVKQSRPFAHLTGLILRPGVMRYIFIPKHDHSCIIRFATSPEPLLL